MFEVDKSARCPSTLGVRRSLTKEKSEIATDAFDMRASGLCRDAEGLFDSFDTGTTALFGHFTCQQRQRCRIRFRIIRLDRLCGAKDPETSGFSRERCIHQSALLMWVIGAAATHKFHTHRSVERLGGAEVRCAMAPNPAFEKRFSKVVSC